MCVRAIQALSGWKRQIIAFFSGTLTVLALPPFYFFAICFFTFPLFVWLFDGLYEKSTILHKRHYILAILTGWSFGFGYFIAGLWWLGSAMLVDIAVYGWAIPFAVLCLPAFLACYYALAGFVALFLWQRGYGRIIVLGCSFGLVEWLRGHMFTGFPWNATGYLAMPFPLLMQPASVIGIYGMNVLAVLIYATPAILNEQRGRKVGFSVSLVLIAADISFGFYRLYNLPLREITARKTIYVRIVQPSISQDTKINSAVQQENFERHLHLTLSPSSLKGDILPQLVIWPESSVPYVLARDPSALSSIGNALKQNQIALVGTIRAEEKEDDKGTYQYFNSLQAVDPNGRIVASADKVRLVPFGEYLPFSALFHKFGLKAIAEISGGYSSGMKQVTIQLANGLVILPLICYEAIFPIEYDGSKPDILVNITNDAWFGNTPGPWQHFAQARIRAVEEGISLIRVANNGISAAIDPYGRIVTMIGHNETGFADVELHTIFSKF